MRDPEVFSSPPRISPLSLSRLDVIKTKPRAGPPSRRLINCFVRDTSLFKRNWALPPPSSSPAVSTTLRTLRIRATRTCLYSVLEPAFFSRRQRQRRHRGSLRNLRIRFRPPCPPRIEDLGEKGTPAGVNEKVDRPFYTKSTDAETTSWRDTLSLGIANVLSFIHGSFQRT